MKQTLSKLAGAVILVALLGGCMTTQQKQWTCETAQAAYEAYKAVIAAGHTPSNDEVLAAAGASAFLRLWCGWEVPTTRAVPYDQNWVVTITPPKR